MMCKYCIGKNASDKCPLVAATALAAGACLVTVNADRRGTRGGS